MTQLQPVRGTHDWLPEEHRKFRHVVEVARARAERYGFQQMDTPIFEFTDVFHRTLGESSDVVSKETYSFTDRGGESLTLRPENTASVVRAYLSNGLQGQLPCKFFYAGPMFRYERPQKGRMRQFHQFGVELLGVAEVQADIEVIALGHHILAELGLADYAVLQLNTLGDEESRAAYRAALLAYFEPHRAKLSADSQTRLAKNPLRILDSKDEGDQALIADAPRMSEHRNAASHQFYEQVQAGLSALSIPYQCNESLVRGLDYYNHTVFEFTTTALGAQGAVLSGGRYDGLVVQMGGPATPGVGFAAGIERLVGLMELAGSFQPEATPVVAIMPMGEAAQIPAMALAYELRRAGLTVDQAYRGNLAKRMKKADKAGAVWAVLIGEDELAQQSATLRDLRDGSQQTIGLTELAAALQQRLTR